MLSCDLVINKNIKVMVMNLDLRFHFCVNVWKMQTFAGAGAFVKCGVTEQRNKNLTMCSWVHLITIEPPPLFLLALDKSLCQSYGLAVTVICCF